MTETTTESVIWRAAPPHARTPVDAVINELQHLSTGDLAALRKLNPSNLHHPVFWKLSTGVLQPWLPSGDGEHRVTRERQWALILSVAASVQHTSRTRLGTALIHAEIAEVRLTRLLRVRDVLLPPAVRTITHQLAAAGVAFDVADIAWLVLSEEQRDEAAARHQIARDYYRATNIEIATT